MINHVRTLLRNSQAPADFAQLGDEYVPAEARACVLTGTHKAVWRTMFGPVPDNTMLNWRLQQYLTCIHASDLAPYALLRDSRITYWPFGSTLFDRRLRGPIVTDLAESGKTLTVLGKQFPETHECRLGRRWTVETIDSNTLEIAYADTQGASRIDEMEYSVTDGLSSSVALPESSLTFRFQEGTGSRWSIEMICRPAATLADVLRQLTAQLHSSAVDALFPQSSSLYSDLRQAWESGLTLPHKVGAVALALAYGIEDQNDAGS